MTQTRESPKAQRAFQAYCNQEKRSLRKLAEEIRRITWHREPLERQI